MPAFTVDLDQTTFDWLKDLKKNKKIKTQGEIVRQCLTRMRPTIDLELGNV